jgi:hypothetical protein
MIRTIPKVIPSRTVDVTRLGWISGKRALARRNFPANFEYVDLRGFGAAELDRALREEREAYAKLEAAAFSQEAIDYVDAAQLASSLLPQIDFGVAAAVVAVSALGCVPVTSCRGPTLGTRRHSLPAPLVVFYARRTHVPTLIEAVSEADCQIVNNAAKIEIYADDVRKIHRFAAALSLRIAAAAPGRPPGEGS